MGIELFNIVNTLRRTAVIPLQFSFALLQHLRIELPYAPRIMKHVVFIDNSKMLHGHWTPYRK